MMIYSIKCCGYGSIQDRAVPVTCSVALGTEIACKQHIISNVQLWHQYITMTIVVLLAIQV
jgi:hypothetical protein